MSHDLDHCKQSIRRSKVFRLRWMSITTARIAVNHKRPEVWCYLLKYYPKIKYTLFYKSVIIKFHSDSISTLCMPAVLLHKSYCGSKRKIDAEQRLKSSYCPFSCSKDDK